MRLPINVILSLSMILFSLNLFSGEEKLNVKPDKEGPVYIGLFGGPVFFHNKETLSVRQVWGPFAGDTFRLPSKKYRDISAALGAILGITKSWDNILLSAEISAAYNTLRYSHTQHIGLDRGTHEIKCRMGEMYSISMLPGYRPVDYLRLYIKGGGIVSINLGSIMATLITSALVALIQSGSLRYLQVPLCNGC